MYSSEQIRPDATAWCSCLRAALDRSYTGDARPAMVEKRCDDFLQCVNKRFRRRKACVRCHGLIGYEGQKLSTASGCVFCFDLTPRALAAFEPSLKGSEPDAFFLSNPQETFSATQPSTLNGRAYPFSPPAVVCKARATKGLPFGTPPY